MRPLDERRRVALEIARAGIVAVDPERLVASAIAGDSNALRVGDWSSPWADIERVFVVGAGKATAAMVRAAESELGDRISSGIAITKDGHAAPTRHVAMRLASHPIPDERGVAATVEMLDALADLVERDVVIVLLSGGGSALLVAPAPGITLLDKQETTGALLACGATIDEVNSVRKRLSRVKGGQLARACQPAHVVTLALSDVIGDPPDVIASGPTAPDTSTFASALAVVDRYEMRDRIPASAMERLERGVHGEIAETPDAADSAFAHSSLRVIGSNSTALDAAATEARAQGYDARIMTSSLCGEARDVATAVSSLAEEARGRSAPTALIFGGETTVTLGDHPGRGGRNQELAISAALSIAGSDDIVLMSIGTDGTDGPTDAAGGIVDGATVARAEALGLSAADHLTRHDAYPLLERTGDLIRTGPTGTNVMDIVVALVG